MSRPAVILAAAGILLVTVSAAAAQSQGGPPALPISPSIQRLTPQDIASVSSLVSDPLSLPIDVTPDLKKDIALIGAPREPMTSSSAVVSASTSLGQVFTSHGTESLISSVADLPTILTDLPGLVVDRSIELVQDSAVRKRALLVLELVSAIYALAVAAYFGYRALQRLRRDAALRAKGMRRVRVRRKRRRNRATKPRKSQYA